VLGADGAGGSCYNHGMPSRGFLLLLGAGLLLVIVAWVIFARNPTGAPTTEFGASTPATQPAPSGGR